MILRPLELLDVESLLVGSEYFINSQELEDKVRDLLPSQGGAGAGFDLSASTQIIPVIDLTESAQGSNLRQDLQTASSKSTTKVDIENTTTTVVSTTGFYRVFATLYNNASANGTSTIDIFDGTTSKPVFFVNTTSNAKFTEVINPFVVFLDAGDVLRGTTNVSTLVLSVFTHQIADISGNLTNPLGFS